MKILNWFPKPKAITELTLLSKLELIVYGFIFVLTIFIYFSWTRIPVHDVYIEVDRVDPLARNENNYGLSIPDSDSTVGNYCKISIITQMSELYYDEDQDQITFFFRTPYKVNKTELMKNDIEPSVNNNRYFDWLYVDSLFENGFHEYNKNIDRYNLPDIYYIKFKYTYYAFPFFRNQEFYYQDKKRICKSVDSLVFYCHTFVKKMDFIKSKAESGSEGFVVSDGDYHTSQKHGVFDKPSLFSLYDISQCYYRFHIISSLVNNIDLEIKNTGANEFIFIENYPDSIQGQTFLYKIRSASIFHSIEANITFHVHSIEMDGKQKSRLFFITTLLSALITIYLAFVIIYIYRKTNRLFKTKNRKTIERIVNHSTGKHRNFHSRKKNK